MIQDYYINGNGGFKTTLPLIKKNNYYVMKAFNFLAVTAKNGKPNEIGGLYRPALLNGELPKSDKVTGFNTNKLAEKLKFLTLQLSDKRHPENIVNFRNSFLYNSILCPLFDGYTADKDQAWNNYKFNENGEQALKNKTPVEAAIYCLCEDYNSPLGLNWAVLIDTFVKTDKNGNFYLEDDVSIDEEMKINKAMQQQLKDLRSNKRFTASFTNYVLNKSLDNYDYPENE